MANISKNIFHAYDVRGSENGEELNKESFELLGKAYGTYCARNRIKKVVVGYDSRSSSFDFARSLTRGLLSAGRDVINIGHVTTPMVYWAQYFFKTRAGVMVTASHNPLGQNGAKFGAGFAATLGGKDLMNLYSIIIKDDFHMARSGNVMKQSIASQYIKDICSRISIEKKQKVLLNTGSGVGGLFAEKIFKRAGCDVISINSKIDPSFPKYMPNPVNTKMIEDTRKAVKKHKVDFAFMFDGDCDRVGVLDENGDNINPDYFYIFLIKGIARQKKKIKAVYDVTSTSAVASVVESLGGEAIIAPTGHTNIKNKMKETKADIGGESSGHMFFSHGYYGFDDGFFAGLKLAEYFSTQHVSDMLDSLPKYYVSPRWSIGIKGADRFEIVQQITKEFKKEKYNTILVDGVRVVFEDGFGVLRASNTSNSIVVRCEAKTQSRLIEIESLFKEKINKFDEYIQGWRIE